MACNTGINTDKYLYEELPAIGANLYEALPAIGANQLANDNVFIEMISSLEMWHNIILTFYVFHYFVVSGHENRAYYHKLYFKL